MKTFSFEWSGETIEIEERDVFRLVDAVEGVVTIGELAAMQADFKAIRYAKLAEAFSALLSECGFRESKEDIRRKFISGFRENDAKDSIHMALDVINWLMVLLLDGFDPAGGGGEADSGEGKPEAPDS